MRETKEPSLYQMVTKEELIATIVDILGSGTHSELYQTAREVLERRYGCLDCDLAYPDDEGNYELTVHNPSRYGGVQ